MRKLDNKRIEEYLKKHVSLKKWVSIMLVVALLVTTATMYSLNKSANALSGDEAEDVGMVLEGDNIEELASGNVESGDTDSIQDSEESESTEGSEEESSESENTESENSENSETENAESENSETQNSGSENSEESANAEATSEESNSGEASTEESVENNTESTEANAENANSEEGATDQTTTGETTDVADASTENSSEDDENTDAATKGDSKKDSNEVELTEDVVLTVSYVTEDGEKIADEKEINLSESLDFTTEAPKQEGYEFKKAEIDGVEINKITAKQDANGHKYYEVTVGKSVTESEETTSNENAVDGEFTDRSATDETLSESTTSEETAAESTSSEGETSENTAEELTSEDSSSSDASSSDSSSSETSSEDSASSDTVSEENASNETTEETSSSVSLTEAAEGDVVVIKENKTVVLTYAIDAQSDITLTAKYVDKDGKDIKDSEELKITAETELKNAESILVEGYFYLNASVGEQKITKITPVFEDESSDSEETSKKIKEYTVSIVNGEDITITENTEIVLTYVKATEETVFNYSDDKVIVKAEASAKGLFPEGVELKVTEITSKTDNYNYDAYMNALNDNAEAIAKDAGLENSNEYTEDNTLMYDIAFMYDGKEIQPKEGSVNVSIEFKGNQLSEELSASEKEDVTVIHLPIKEEVKEASEVESTEQATQITAEDIEVKTLKEATAEVGNDEKVEFSEDNFSIYAVTVYQSHATGKDTYETVLGDAVNFGIVTDNIYVNESQTNFAAKNVYPGAQTGNNLTNPMEQTFIAAQIVCEGDAKLHIKEETAYFIVPEAYKDKLVHDGGADRLKLDTAYTSEQLETMVGDMLKYTREASKDLAKRATSKDTSSATGSLTLVKDKTESSKWMIDTTGKDFSDDGTFYVEISEKDLTDKLDQSDKLHIYKKKNQTIVFNVTAGSEISLQKYRISIDGSALLDPDSITDQVNSEYNARIAETIIWNFENATKVTNVGPTVGVFISGQSDAEWVNDSRCGGWIAFPTVRIGDGEFHNIYNKIKQISGTAQFQAYKTIDGQNADKTGFKFTLYKKDSSAADGWTAIQTVGNDEETPHNIIFDSITFGDSTTINEANYQYVSKSQVGASQDFVYKIVESAGATDDKGNAYTADTKVYYAKVTASVCKQNNVTSSIYIKVSAPAYYNDEQCSQAYNGIPVFNNTTKSGSVGIALYKYLNNEDPGEHEFSFTVRALKSDNTLETLTNNLKNVGKNISFAFDYNSGYFHHYDVSKKTYDERLYLVITENDIANSSSSVSATKDDSYIFVRIDDAGTSKQKIYYYKTNKDNGFASRLEDPGYSNKLSYFQAICNGTSKLAISAEDAAFYNVGGGDLRIHKMVVNDWGSEYVTGIVKSVTGETKIDNKLTFRITNNGTGNYIVFNGFGRNAGDTSIATEYDEKHNVVKEYTVYYNANAQWTVKGIPSGTYTVEEVGDGVTFTYDPKTNTSTVDETVNLSRVTTYSVTEDDEDTNSWGGYGGQNWRKLFACDVPNHSYLAPENVKVGSTEVKNTSHTQTVQVSNFYSVPLGPIQITKNFSGGEWKSDMAFTFKIEGIGYTARDSEGKGVKLSKQPMPQAKGSTEVVDTVTVTGADATDNTAIASFESIPYRYEGTYYYKITEQADSPISGVKYDDSVYYVKVEVKKKNTTFKKLYSYDNNKHSLYVEGGSKSTTTKDEEVFYYLGADITYSDDKNFGNVLAKYELYLDKDPNTGTPIENEYKARLIEGKSEDVCFNNYIFGNLTVKKIWRDVKLADDSKNHTELTLYIWQRQHIGETYTDWVIYGTTQLSGENNWTQTVDGLPLRDSKGTFEYLVKEPDNYNSTHLVSYKYNGVEVVQNDQTSEVVIGNDTVNDPGYVMTANNLNYGEVVITNTALSEYALPSTGGNGTWPFAAAGAGMVIISILGSLYFGKKRKS